MRGRVNEKRMESQCTMREREREGDRQTDKPRERERKGGREEESCKIISSLFCKWGWGGEKPGETIKI